MRKHFCTKNRFLKYYPDVNAKINEYFNCIGINPADLKFDRFVDYHSSRWEAIFHDDRERGKALVVGGMFYPLRVTYTGNFYRKFH